MTLDEGALVCQPELCYTLEMILTTWNELCPCKIRMRYVLAQKLTTAPLLCLNDRSANITGLTPLPRRPTSPRALLEGCLMCCIYAVWICGLLAAGPPDDGEGGRRAFAA